MKTLIGIGTYGIPDAARLARVHQRTAARWIAGRGSDRAGRIIETDLPTVQERHALSFLDLIDLLVVGRFREEGVSLQTLRRVHQVLRVQLDTPHPFGHRRLLTDGSSVFMETFDQVGDPQLEEILSGQRVMRQVLKPYLRQIDYSERTQTAVRWNIARGVVLDPTRSFGRPIIASEGTTTYVLASACAANDGNVELVADLFDVSPEAVRQAVEFEREYSPRRAA